MKTLIIYYSRTGVTRKVAEKLKEKLNCDVEEIRDLANRQGALGYLKSGREAMQEKPANIEDVKSDLSIYDLVIIGTPIWGFNMSSPARAFILNNKERIKKFALFATQGGNGAEKAFAEMAKILDGESVANLTLLTKEVVKNEYSAKLDEFVNRLK